MYVERFLAQHRADIHGRVLEIAAPDYTSKFGTGVERSDILMATEGNPQATIVGDLADAPQIPDDTFDCAIVTQTLQFIYDVRAALATLHRILVPGGVLLATAPGLTKISRIEDEEFGEWWHYTGRSLRRLGEETFPGGSVEVETYGNVLSASGFLYGLAASDLKPARARRARPLLRGRHRAAGPESRLAATEDAAGLAVDPVRQALLDGCEALLQRVEPSLEADDVRLAERGGFDCVGRLVGERRHRKLEREVACLDLAERIAKPRVHDDPPEATPSSTSASETTCSS